MFMIACSSNQKMQDSVEVIPVETDNAARQTAEFLEKIEIIPLETSDTSLVNAYQKIVYDKSLDMFAIYDKEQVVQTFSGDGTFVGDSKHRIGNGPQEYQMAVDIQFNSYKKGVDLLNPYGKIYTYSTDFKYIETTEVNPEYFFDTFMPVSESEYLFTIPSIWVGQEICYVNTATSESYAMKYEGTISAGNTMDKNSFYSIGDDVYFVPMGINYKIFRVDMATKQLEPYIYLDFGAAQISEDNLPGEGVGIKTSSEGVEPDRKRDRRINDMQQRSRYIRNNNYVAPLVKFFNDDFFYLFFAQGKNSLGGHYIYNRKKRNGYLLKDGKPFMMHPCFGISDNVLMAICDAYYVSKLVDVNLMSTEELLKLEGLKEDDNPVIIKYYLRK